MSFLCHGVRFRGLGDVERKQPQGRGEKGRTEAESRDHAESELACRVEGGQGAPKSLSHPSWATGPLGSSFTNVELAEGSPTGVKMIPKAHCPAPAPLRVLCLSCVTTAHR